MKMPRVLGAIVVFIGILAALVTIASGVVTFCPTCNPFRPGPPNIAGEWDGSLTIVTDHGPTGDIHLSLAEKSDGSLTGQFTVSPPLLSANNGSLTVGTVTDERRVDFIVASSTEDVNLTFSGVYDEGNHRLSGVYLSRNGYSGTWYVSKSQGGQIQSVVPTVASVDGLQYIAAQLLRGGIPLVLIIVGLGMLSRSKVAQVSG